MIGAGAEGRATLESDPSAAAGDGATGQGRWLCPLPASKLHCLQSD